MAAGLARATLSPSTSALRLLSSFSPHLFNFPFTPPSLNRPPPHLRRLSISSCAAAAADTFPPISSSPNPTRWRPICLYYTQGRCTMMDDPLHLEKFNHSCSLDFSADPEQVQILPAQHFDHFLVLDLEGKVEILEFPVLMLCARSLQVVDFFHRFVRPTEMSEQRIAEYIEGKYGKFGVDRVWHDTAIPFNEVIERFEEWLAGHRLWSKASTRGLNRAAFVTCGNWDLNFYKRSATGMVPMLRQLQIPQLGSHHLGIDDTKNIAKVLLRMIADGAIMNLSAIRNPAAPRAWWHQK